MKRILMTGGGTAGHVTPNIALMPRLTEMGYEIYYIGTYTGIEKGLIEEVRLDGDKTVKYFGISSGKLRRYFDIRNFTDPFRVIKGYFEAKRIMKKLHPDVVFSKGGFVTVPVVWAAHRRHVPVVIHESDMTPGLANKLALPKATRVCCNFPETAKDFPEGVASVTGSPIRQELFEGDADSAQSFCGFSERRPTILVVGGSTGSVNVNNAIHGCLTQLTAKYNVIHLCGKGKTDDAYNDVEGYRQYEYIGDELPDMFSLADIVISRAGANAICELLALKKPNILIPLSRKASRGDQILNAESFRKSGYSMVIDEDELTSERLLKAVDELYKNKNKYIETMTAAAGKDSITLITDIIDSVAK